MKSRSKESLGSKVLLHKVREKENNVAEGGVFRRNTPEKGKGIREKNKMLKIKQPEKVGEGGQEEDRRHFKKGGFAEYCRDQTLQLCPHSPSLFLSLPSFSLSV